ncbi:MAG TPA: type II toxin-antitoxin system HicB family antitoxin [Ktedonobacterales bacterium]|jgi:predicted RNase H-like HicB family nuclease
MKHYTMLIRWSAEDDAYVVSLPEWRYKSFGEIVTHGATYEEAARNGQEALDLLIEDALARGEPLPEPHLYAAAG